MIGVVVVTHGQLATELVNAAEMIVGDLPRFTAVSIGWHDEVNDAREDIVQAIALAIGISVYGLRSSGGIAKVMRRLKPVKFGETPSMSDANSLSVGPSL